MIGKLNASLCRVILLLACGLAGFGLAVICLRFPLILPLAAFASAWWKYRRWRGSGTAYGTARAATLPEIARAGMLEEDGLILGATQPDMPTTREALSSLINPAVRSDIACRTLLSAWYGQRWSGERLLKLRKHVHILTCSPTGGGKSVSVLVPNLLSHPGNCVVVDPKGELYRLTAEHRRKRFGHRIIRVDPFGVCGPGSDTLNPFDWIDPKADDFLDQVRDLANMMIIRQKDAKDPHWDESAEVNLTGFATFVCGCETDPKQRNLTTVRRLAASRERYAKAVEVMQQTDACQGVIRQLGGQLTWHMGEEQASVMSTFGRQTAFLDSVAVSRNVASSSFDPMILRTGRATVYLILPHDRLASLSRLQRMWIGMIMRRITGKGADERRKVLWLLDEMGHIGNIQAIEDAVTLMRGMGMRLWFFFQSLDQLKVCFGDKAITILDNIGTHQYFAINSYTTAEEISKRIGETTLTVRSGNSGTSYSTPAGGGKGGPDGGSQSTSTGVNMSEIARRLLKPEEVLTLPKDPATGLIFHENLPVVVARMIRYYDHPAFQRGRAGRQPGLGLAATVMAGLTLGVSAVFTVLALAVASAPPAVRVPQSSRQAAGPNRNPGPPATVGPAYRTQAPGYRQPQFMPFHPGMVPVPYPAHAGGRTVQRRGYPQHVPSRPGYPTRVR